MLPYPFNCAFEHGHTITYKCSENKDHKFVEKLGYNPEKISDGGTYPFYSHLAPGLDGLSLSKYGDWGVFYGSLANDTNRKIFHDMCEGGIISPWQIIANIFDENGDTHRYYYDGGIDWSMRDRETLTWLKAEDPFKKYARPWQGSEKKKTEGKWGDLYQKPKS